MIKNVISASVLVLVGFLTGYFAHFSKPEDNVLLPSVVISGLEKNIKIHGRYRIDLKRTIEEKLTLKSVLFGESFLYADKISSCLLCSEGSLKDKLDANILNKKVVSGIVIIKFTVNPELEEYIIFDNYYYVHISGNDIAFEIGKEALGII